MTLVSGLGRDSSGSMNPKAARSCRIGSGFLRLQANMSGMATKSLSPKLSTLPNLYILYTLNPQAYADARMTQDPVPSGSSVHILLALVQRTRTSPKTTRARYLFGPQELSERKPHEAQIIPTSCPARNLRRRALLHIS